MAKEVKRIRHIDYKTPIRTQFGEKVRELRLQQKKEMGEVADEAGITESYIGMIERGERNISLDKVENLARALNVKVKDLFDF